LEKHKIKKHQETPQNFKQWIVVFAQSKVDQEKIEKKFEKINFYSLIDEGVYAMFLNDQLKCYNIKSQKDY